jgi:glycosyltransferase 2 family protein
MPLLHKPSTNSSQHAATPARTERRSSKTAIILAAVVIVVLLALLSHAGFHWHNLGQTFRHLAIRPLLAALVAIYVAFALRSVRWSLLLHAEDDMPAEHTGPFSTVAPQIIGFTATALFGRLADLVRPWLIARRLKTSLATQLAVYSVERVLDLAAAAAIIASPLLLPSRDASQHKAVAHIAAVALIAVLGLTVIVVAMRVLGERLPLWIERNFSRISPGFSSKAAAAVRDFQHALHGLRAGRFLGAVAVSLLMWGCIAVSYMLSARVCQSSPELAVLSFAATMPILAASLGGSLLQLPGLGWLTQVGLLAATIHATTGAALEPATACGVVIICVTTLSIIPPGLVAAHFGGIRLRDVSSQAHEAS